MNRQEIYQLIDKERKRQDLKWGPVMRVRHLSDMIWLTIILEEVGEVAEAILKKNWDNLQEELIQVLAACVAWLEDFGKHQNGDYKEG